MYNEKTKIPREKIIPLPSYENTKFKNTIILKWRGKKARERVKKNNDKNIFGSFHAALLYIYFTDATGNAWH